jgi:hypothetical protein
VSEPDVAEMWQAHCDRSFPPLLRGAEVGDIDVVLLDAETARRTAQTMDGASCGLVASATNPQRREA